MRLRKPSKHEALIRNSGEQVPISTCWDARSAARFYASEGRHGSSHGSDC